MKAFKVTDNKSKQRKCDCIYSVRVLFMIENVSVEKLKKTIHYLYLLTFSPSLSPLTPPEERVAPLEVSRSKLSRHLQGLVFRCHKCTFTCSSDQALQLHLQKHAEIKPYQCQLCYYDTNRRIQLEDHLRLEHKVGWRSHIMVWCSSKFKLVVLNRGVVWQTRESCFSL